METIYLDIMVSDRFYRQIPYRYCPLFAITESEIREYVIEKVPSLKRKNFLVEPSINRI